MMKPTSKPFDRNLYEADDSVKEIFITKLHSMGFEAEVNPDKYGIDILSNWAGPNTGIEIEIKHNWRGKEFPFKTVHFAARKFKFLNQTKEVKFVMFNHDRTHVLVVDGKEFKKIVTKNTIYTDEETFYEIPIENCSILNLEE